MIILGTDWWTDCDDVAAVRIACRLANKGVWNIAGFVLNACMEHSAGSLDGFIRSEGIIAPIGIDFAADDFGGRPPYQESLAKSLGSSLEKMPIVKMESSFTGVFLAGAPDNSSS